MLITSLVRKDLLRVGGDRRALMVNLALPLLLTAIMGLSFGGGSSGQVGVSAIPLAMVSTDLPTLVKERLAESLAESGYFAVTWTDTTEAAALVRSGQVAAAVVLPADLFRQVFDGRQVAIELWKDPGSPLKSGIVQEILSRMLLRYQAGDAAFAALWPSDRIATEGGFTTAEYFSGDFNQVWQRFRRAGEDPVLQEAADRFLVVMDHQVALSEALSRQQITLAVNDKAPAGQAAAGGKVNLFDYFLPSFAGFFLMFGVAASARDIHREREQRTLQRQLLSPLTGLQFVVGKWVAAALQGIAQLGVLFLAGALLFRVNLGPDPYSLALIVVLTSTAAAGVFILLALVSRNERMMDSLSTVVILVSAMIGGNFLPIDSMPAWAHVFGRVVFNYWANLGFTNVMVRNLGLGEAILPALVLGAFTLTLFVVNVGLFTVRARRGGLA
jgi:ABC-type multidrug transport system permease subunit